MLYLLLTQLVSLLLSLLLDLFALSRRSERHKDLQTLLLRQQLRILQRRNLNPRISHWEKLGLAVLAARMSSLQRKGHHPLAPFQARYPASMAQGLVKA